MAARDLAYDGRRVMKIQSSQIVENKDKVTGLYSSSLVYGQQVFLDAAKNGTIFSMN